MTYMSNGYSCYMGYKETDRALLSSMEELDIIVIWSM